MWKNKFIKKEEFSIEYRKLWTNYEFLYELKEWLFINRLNYFKDLEVDLINKKLDQLRSNYLLLEEDDDFNNKHKEKIKKMNDEFEYLKNKKKFICEKIYRINQHIIEIQVFKKLKDDWTITWIVEDIFEWSCWEWSYDDAYNYLFNNIKSFTFFEKFDWILDFFDVDLYNELYE